MTQAPDPKPAAGAVVASLVAIAGPSAGKRYPLSVECILGRSFNSDIYIGDLNVSRRHARIRALGDEHIVEDLGSGNGTFVNDQQVTAQTLHARDVIRIGGSSFRYEQEKKQQRWSSEVLTVIAEAVPAADLLERARTAPPLLDPKEAARTTANAAAAPQAPSPAPVAGVPTGPLEQAPAEDLLRGLGDGRAVKMLESMYAVADAIATELDLDKLLEKILDHLFDVFPQAERGFVLLVNPTTRQLVPEAVKQRRGPASHGLKFSQTMVDQVLERGQGVIRGNTIPPTGLTRPARPPAPDDVVRPEDASSPSSSAVPKMGAPLMSRGEALGTLHLEGRPSAASFSPEDLALLSGIARQAAVAIANARTGQQLLLQQRIEADLQLARKIQQSFLPQKLTQVAGLEFDTHYLPAQHVGGDFYDVIQLDRSRIGILVGDISGKGVSAALLMAKVTSDIRLFSRAVATPGEVLTAANRTLMESGQDAMFATVLYLLLDLEAKTFTVANAGHQPPMVCSRRFAGISELDDATGVALGVVPDMVYTQEVYELVAGDCVLMYTDGINEALNRQGQEYGMQRLRSVVATGMAEPAQVTSRVVADVRRFVGNAPQSDDQTLVAFGLRG